MNEGSQSQKQCRVTGDWFLNEKEDLLFIIITHLKHVFWVCLGCSGNGGTRFSYL